MNQATKNSYQRQANYVGTPTTWVFAKERTLQAVVDALTNGRGAVSANPYAPRVEFYADVDQDGKMDMMMGDNAKSRQARTFRIQLTGNTVPGGEYPLRVIKDGDPFKTLKAAGGKITMADFTDTPKALGRTYYRVEVKGPPTAYPEVPGSTALNCNMVGLSNPIYFNFDPNF